MNAIRVGCFCGWRSKRKPDKQGFVGDCKLCGDTAHSMVYIKSYKEFTNGLDKKAANTD